MISDPVTFGITDYDTTFVTIENGPGMRTKRTAQEDVSSVGGLVTVQNQDLTISHSAAPGKGRDRSLFRLDADFISDASLSLGTSEASASGSVYLVMDLPGVKASGGAHRTIMAKFLLARLLGFLSENAVAAPDFSFASNEAVLKFINKES